MSKKSNFLFVDCSEAATCCDKAQYEEADFLEKIKLTIHLMFCKTCRKFSKRNSKLTNLMQESKLETCPEEKKNQWRQQIKKEFAEDRN
ncbi:hypothetical protein [Christiangramia forsetii]|uniref:Glycine dehydrogenase n=2 Tax=Christiangramia forsetii TaxID=411153 RepID=A0M5D2_CHRFK|nr:hypothetical protein [Christiangramia forsetii]GGG21261.1 hypothetical protein GCM10011532_00300 [Christiangramia forsetii]CAL67827.1 hypothetical protein GFO_2873 [Christiangramia forsetii KT0803]